MDPVSTLQVHSPSFNNGHPLAEYAKRFQNLLNINDTFVVNIKSGVAYKKAMFICAPLSHSIHHDPAFTLANSYQSIFEKGLKEGVKKIVIPSFSTSNGGFAHSEAAYTAFTEAFKFLQAYPDVSIDFILYRSKFGNCDQENINAYRETLEIFNFDEEFRKISGEESGSVARLQVFEGEVQSHSGDIVVIPVDESFNGVGIFNALSKAVPEENMFHYQPVEYIQPPFVNHQPFVIQNSIPPKIAENPVLIPQFVVQQQIVKAPEINLMPEKFISLLKLPRDHINNILSLCDIKSLHNISATCRQIKFDFKSDILARLWRSQFHCAPQLENDEILKNLAGIWEPSPKLPHALEIIRDMPYGDRAIMAFNLGSALKAMEICYKDNFKKWDAITFVGKDSNSNLISMKAYEFLQTCLKDDGSFNSLIEGLKIEKCVYKSSKVYPSGTPFVYGPFNTQKEMEGPELAKVLINLSADIRRKINNNITFDSENSQRIKNAAHIIAGNIVWYKI